MNRIQMNIITNTIFIEKKSIEFYKILNKLLKCKNAKIRSIYENNNNSVIYFDITNRHTLKHHSYTFQYTFHFHSNEKPSFNGNKFEIFYDLKIFKH